MDLTTVADVKEYLESQSDDSRVEALIQAFITGLSAEVEQYLDRELVAGTYTEYHDVAYNQFQLFLRAYPVTSITGIWNDTSRVFAASSAVSADTYKLYEDRGKLYFDGIALYPGPGVVKIVYAGGMAADSAAFIAAYPAIAHACAAEVAARFQRKNQQGAAAVNFATGGVSLLPRGQFVTNIEDVLQPYARILVA